TTVAIAVDNSAAGIRAMARALRSWPFTPMAAELLDATGAGAVGLPHTTTLLLRLGGNARAVSAQRKRAASLGRPVEVDRATWEKVRAIEEGSAAVIRIADLPSASAERWDDAQQLCANNGTAAGSPARGVV